MTTAREISCPSSVEKGLVCSHAVTVQQLRSWGIDCGFISDHITEPGPAFHVARHKAWQQGKIRMCSLDPRAHPVIPWKFNEQDIIETMKWVQDHKVTITKEQSNVSHSML